MKTCSNYDELEIMELFAKHILPIIKTLNREDILSNIDYWEERIKDYYSYCEKTVGSIDMSEGMLGEPNIKKQMIKINKGK